MKFLFKTIVIVIAFWGVIGPFIFFQPEKETEKKSAKNTINKATVKKEQPLHNVKLPLFSSIKDIHLKKKTFFNFLKPAVEKENQRILRTREKLLKIEEKLGLEQTLTADEQVFLSQLLKEYRVKGNLTLFQQVNKLINRVDIIPTELVLVQAANESAWGTSRFARIGLNFFGLWCYKKGCGMVPNSRTAGLQHEVAAFDSVEHAVSRYINNLNTNNAYIVFRAIRQQLRQQAQPLSPNVLATGLLPYSERGVDYVSEIIDMLRHNAKYINSTI